MSYGTPAGLRHIATLARTILPSTRTYTSEDNVDMYMYLLRYNIIDFVILILKKTKFFTVKIKY